MFPEGILKAVKDDDFFEEFRKIGCKRRVKTRKKKLNNPSDNHTARRSPCWIFLCSCLSTTPGTSEKAGCLFFLRIFPLTVPAGQKREGTNMKKSKPLTPLLSAVLCTGMFTALLPVSAIQAETIVLTDSQEQEGTLLPYQDTSLTSEERAADLVSRMTLSEKQSQLQARTAPAISRLGIRAYDWWSEALHGVARSGEATSFPTGLGIAASWNRDLVYQIAEATSDEARAYTNEKGKGLSYWSPTINMARDPRWGRAEETYGEDPYLTAQTGIAFVRGMQGSDENYLKTIATAKHFAANNSEFNRHDGSSDMDQRTLHEYYVKAFKDVVEEADVQSVMTSYNRLNGIPMPANQELIETMLRRTWGFSGYVTSDCGAIRDIYSTHRWMPDGWDHAVNATEATALALQAGTDLNCGSVYACEAVNAVNEGILSEDDIDVALVRLFTARMKTGEFDPQEKVPYASAAYSWNSQISNAEHTKTASQASDEAVVLLKNKAAASDAQPLLPLSAEDTENIVIIGEQANNVVLGDYSGTPRAANRITPVQGLQNLLGQDRVTYIPVQSAPVYGTYSFNVRSFILQNEEGTALRSMSPSENDSLSDCRVESGGNLGYTRPGSWICYKDISLDEVSSIAMEAAFPANEARGGRMEIHLDAPDGPLAGTLVLSATGGWQSYQTFRTLLDAENKTGSHDLYFVVQDPLSGLQLSSEQISTIQQADAVIAYVGTIESDSAEEQDRITMDLPRSQEALIEQMVSLNPRTAVWIQSVGEVNVESFKDGVPSILWTTYNGQDQGGALARTLFGENNPSGRLPFTWYASEAQLPDIGDYTIRASETSNGRTYQYFQGEASYAFGHGLSYTQFAYDNLQLSAESLSGDGTLQVSFTLTNTGSRTGAEVAQLYVTAPETGEELPLRELKNFEKVLLAPGESQEVTLELDGSDLYFWDEENSCEKLIAGNYTLEVGSASDDARLQSVFAFDGQRTLSLQTARVLPDKVSLDAEKPSNKAHGSLSAALNDESFLDLNEAEVLWTSSNPAAAVVNQKGEVTPTGAGTAVITASVTWQGVTKTDSFAVSVRDTRIQDFGSPKNTDFSALSSWQEAETQGWHVIRPDSASPVSLVPGTGLQIASRYGDLYQTSNSAGNLVARTLEGSWNVTVHLDTDVIPSKIYQQAGLLIYQDDDNYIKLADIYDNKGEAEIQFGQESQGVWTEYGRTMISSEGYDLRVEKKGCEYTFWFKADGQDWVRAGSAQADYDQVNLVLFAFNGEQNQPAMQASFKNVIFDQLADKTLLNQAIAQAWLLQEQGALEGVNAIVRSYFEDCLQKAEITSSSTGSSQDEVNAAWKNLARAIQMLDFKTDRSELLSVIAQAEAMDPADYEAGEILDEFQAALQFARETAERDDVLTEGTLKTACDRLRAAMAALEEVRKPETQLDTALLAWLVQTTQSADLEAYLEEGRAGFAEALQQAKAVLEHPESQEQIDAAAAALHAAWLNLRLAPDESLLAVLQATADSIALLAADDSFSVSLQSAFCSWLVQSDAALHDRTLDAAEVCALIEQGRGLLEQADLEKQNRTEKPESSQKPSGQPVDNSLNTPADSSENRMTSTGKNAESRTETAKKSVSVQASVKTAATLQTASWLAACAGALGMLLQSRKRR